MIIGALCPLGPGTARARSCLLEQRADQLLDGGDFVDRVLQPRIRRD
jgi:hypothetical protein